MWDAANWNWHANNDSNKFLWHWSPRNGFDKKIQDGVRKLGFNSAYFSQRLGARMPEK
jgi:hypothetical protein